MLHLLTSTCVKLSSLLNFEPAGCYATHLLKALRYSLIVFKLLRYSTIGLIKKRCDLDFIRDKSMDMQNKSNFTYHVYNGARRLYVV